MLKRLTSLALAAGFCLGAVTAAAEPVSGPSTNQIIIRLNEDGVRRIQSVRQDDALPGIRAPDGTPVTFVRTLGSDGMVVRLSEDLALGQVAEIAAQLGAQEGILSAEPDRRMYPALVPNDPDYPPGANPVVDPGQWYLFEDTAGIRMPAGWDRKTGSASVVVAVLDTGIIPHRDLLAARILPGYDFIGDLFTANDGDGRDADPSDPGDAVAADECAVGEPASDSSWHGLSVSGVIVAESDNNVDIAGIDFAARLLPVRVLGKCGGFVSDIVDAIRWSAGLSVAGVPDNPTPASVINLSLSGGPAGCSKSEQSAINDAVNAGAVVVVAAGNEAGDVALQSPANCNKVVTVGAVGRDGSRAAYVNVGEETDLSAPGGDGGDGILTLFNTGVLVAGNDTLAFIQGTSFTTAQVSAVAALMWAANGGALNPTMIHDILRLTARAFPDASCTSNTCGQGILDADAALAGALDPVLVLGAAANLSGGGGSGGGCSLGPAATFDPLFPVWLMVAAIALLVRRSRQR